MTHALKYLEDELKKKSEALREARGFIESLQWKKLDYDGMQDECFFCEGFEPTHMPDCRLKKFLENTKEV